MNNLNSEMIEDDMNVDREDGNKFFFEDEKINGININETLGTIPINESLINLSFKEDINGLLDKNIYPKTKPINTNKEIKEIKEIKEDYLQEESNLLH